MGNKSSKKEISEGGERNAKGKKGKKLERALSDSDIPSMRGNANQQKKQRPQSMMPAYTEEEKEEVKPDDSKERAKTKARFENSLHDLLRTWPEYSALESIDTDTIELESIETLQKVFTRISEQYEYNKNLSREKLELSTEVEELREETQGQQQKIKDLQNALYSMEDDIALLKGELKRRGIDPRLPDRNISPDLDRNHDASDGSENLSDSHHAAKERLMKAGYMPTPLIQMTPHKDINHVESLIQRSSSLRKNSRDEMGSQSMESRLTDELNDKIRRLTLDLDKVKFERDTYRNKMEDMERQRDVINKNDGRDNDIVRSLQSDLEREQAANKQLQEKMNTIGNKPRYAIDRKQLENAIIDAFEELKTQALSQRLQETYERNVGRVSSDRRQQFICAVMEESYVVAGRMVRTLMRSIKELILNPTQSDTSKKGSGKPPNSAGPTTNRQEFNFTRGTAQRSSTSVAPSDQVEVPRELMQDIGDYVESVADKVDPARMTELVIDALTREFRDCITPALVNNNQFSNFLHQCCVLAWRMNIAAPPFYIITTQNDSDTTLDRKLHDVNTKSVERTGNQIDFYAWPTLLSRKNGSVLVRGSVILQRA